MDLIWDSVPSGLWQQLHADQRGAMQQSWLYGEALRALSVPVHRVMAFENGRAVAAAQFMVRRIAAYLSLASCARGPVFSPGLDADKRLLFYRQVKASIPTRALRVTLFAPDSTLQSVQQELAGFKRVMTGYSTVMIDLAQPAETLRSAMEGKWRNRLVRAEAEGSLKVFVNASPPQIRWLLAREGEQRATRNFRGLPTEFVQAWMDAAQSPAKAYAVSRAEVGGEIVAAMLFLIQGSVATYHIGWADGTGRKLNAHNLLLWRAMQYLAERGVVGLDLGGVNTHALPGISRFKLGTGGAVVTLAGTYY
jgi:lipid II:glycine glycyltransferase (peptidoglycan interpeptide bridge formation enzyme)